MSDLEFSNPVRITDKNESLACDIKNECGFNRLTVSSIERVDTGFRHQRVTLSSTPTLLRGGVDKACGRRTILIQNQGDSNLYIGNSSVSLTNGFLLYKGAMATFDFHEDFDLYGICDDTTGIAFVLEAS